MHGCRVGVDGLSEITFSLLWRRSAVPTRHPAQNPPLSLLRQTFILTTLPPLQDGQSWLSGFVNGMVTSMVTLTPKP